jgi:hypothetical protein
MIIRSFKSIIVFYLLLSHAVFAQELKWQKTIGGSAYDTATDAFETSDGGFMLGGFSASDISGHKTENSRGGSDYWIVKTDANGLIEWDKTIGGSGLDELVCIRPTSDGGFILGGNSISPISGEKTDSCRGNIDFWIVKADSAGNIQWQKTLGGNEYDYLAAIHQTVDGGYIVGGKSDSDISGDKTDACIGIYDYWILKLDPVGNILWQRTIGGTSSDVLTSLRQTTDGGYIVAGNSISGVSGDKTEPSRGLHDYWLVKIDSIGNIQWRKTLGGNQNDYMHDIIQTDLGGYLVTGYSASDISGDKTALYYGSTDAWFLNLDAAGNILWQKSYGGSEMEGLWSIKKSSTGGYMLSGGIESDISGTVTENSNGTRDYWIMKIDENGVMEWQNTVGGTNTDNSLGVLQTTTGDYLLYGLSVSNAGGDKTENSNGNYDFWVLYFSGNYNLISGIAFADMNNDQFHNPNEPLLKNRVVTENLTGRIAVSNEDGLYSLAVFDSGSFEVSAPLVNHFNAVPVTHSATFTAFHQTDSLNDFAYLPGGLFNDLCITLSPSIPFRSGFNAGYIIHYENTGTTTIANTSIVFYPDTNLTYVSSGTSPILVSPDSVVWNTGTLTPFQSGNIFVTVNVSLGLPIGTVINSGAKIEPLAGDANPNCNIQYWEIVTTGSFDPNDILVNRHQLYTFEFPDPPYLDYIIRFQNTGNDTAFTVKILNPVDTTKLQLHSLEFVATSHPVDIRFISHERNMEFRFDNILLPDSNTNEPLSHGFVRYRVKPKTNLVANDSILNFAAIYFDFNDPVLTNIAITKVVLPTGIHPDNTAGEKSLLLFPNPVNDFFTIEVSGVHAKNFSLSVYNAYGKKIQSLFNGKSPSVKWSKSFDVSSLNKGVYFIKLDGSTTGVVKFVKL